MKSERRYFERRGLADVRPGVDDVEPGPGEELAAAPAAVAAHREPRTAAVAGVDGVEQRDVDGARRDGGRDPALHLRRDRVPVEEEPVGGERTGDGRRHGLGDVGRDAADDAVVGAALDLRHGCAGDDRQPWRRVEDGDRRSRLRQPFRDERADGAVAHDEPALRCHGAPPARGAPAGGSPRL